MLYGCSTDNIENIVVNKVQLDDEISLINQVLPQLNNSNPLCDYKSATGNTGDSTDMVWFNDMFNQSDINLIYRELDTANLRQHNILISEVKIVCIPDSISANDSLTAVPMDITKINRPPNVLLVYMNQYLNNKEIEKPTFSFSRVQIKGNKANFKYWTSRGPMSMRGYNVTCLKKNGAWIVIEHDLFVIA